MSRIVPLPEPHCAASKATATVHNSIAQAWPLAAHTDIRARLHSTCRVWTPLAVQASITCIVVSAPVTGRVAQVSLERTIGTISGGILGCACEKSRMEAP